MLRSLLGLSVGAEPFEIVQGDFHFEAELCSLIVGSRRLRFFGAEATLPLKILSLPLPAYELKVQALSAAFVELLQLLLGLDVAIFCRGPEQHTSLLAILRNTFTCEVKLRKR